MDLLTLIQLLHGIPYAGPVLLYLPAIVTLGAVLSMFVPAPTATSNAVYKFAYEVLQWCALNKLQATNLTAPANTGTVAGPTALSSPRVAVTSAAAPAPAGPVS
jgi:hypothetical protein